MRTCKIDITKIDKARLFKGEKGTYLDIVLIEYKDGPKHGNDGFIKQGVTKEERQSGLEMPIIGSWKRIGAKPKAPEPPKPAAPAAQDDSDSDIPF